MMIGVAPEYLAIWLVWRGASLVLPSWIYQWGDDKLYSLYQRLVLFFFETCTNLEVVLYGDAVEALKKRESVLYLANHQSTVDWLVADMVSVRGGSLGHLRYVMKNTLQLIPLYGHYFYTHGCIYVRHLVGDLPRGYALLSREPSVIRKSEEYARDHNLPFSLAPSISTGLCPSIPSRPAPLASSSASPLLQTLSPISSLHQG
ncbi:hypothetical protein C7M84_015834 [Penaeus vannamei]|uniref:Phospholipid/glycerol acyltransferase domain-containing protein n=1 Tax=Penaeus vannamei TaxID=6689 RepID=A0A3R7LXY8_PENVA|nr:hypothetical protein C7M84_015834 [Penaeus vannamei]